MENINLISKALNTNNNNANANKNYPPSGRE